MRDEQRSDDEWTAAELTRFKTLDPEREPRPELKSRTIDALRARSLLGAPIAVRAAVSPRLLTAMAAAAAAVFVAGTAVGYAVGTRRGNPGTTAVAPVTHAVAQADSATLPPRGPRQIIWF
jgi:hypothetical protein